MRLIRKLAIYALSVAAAVSLCGCSSKGTDEDKMLDYMHDKYKDDTFVSDGVSGLGKERGLTNIVVFSENCPKREIYVWNDGSGSFTDNYLGVIYKDATSHVITQAVTSVTNNNLFVTYVPDFYACPNTNGMMPFKDYLASADSAITFTAVANHSVPNKEVFVENLRHALSSEGINCTGSIYFEKDADVVKYLTANNLDTYLYDGTYIDKLVFNMAKDTWEWE